MNLSGKSVVITGAAGGIGKAFTQRFLAEGARVCAVDYSVEGLDKLVGEVGGSGELLPIQVDVSKEESCQQMADQVKKTWGRVDVIINNAGKFPFKPFEETTYEEWRTTMAINLDSQFLITKALLPLLKESKAGRIVNISSGSIFAGPGEQVPYVASKAGVIGFTRALANALGQYNITANAVTPGVVATEAAIKEFPEGMIDMVAKMGALKRRQTAEDLVGTVLFLSSDESAFMTGQTLNVDGGRSFI
ncbi:SDR family NAD(P)-dependent oxidoreductase [Spirosoma arcticum]